MSRSRWPASLCALTVLFAGLCDVHAHVHLCLEDQKASSAVLHGHEPGDHDHHGPTGRTPADDHEDVDVDLSAQAVLKSFDHDLAAIPPTPVVWIAPNRRAESTTTAADAVSPSRSPPYFVPPLRAPPV